MAPPYVESVNPPRPSAQHAGVSVKWGRAKNSKTGCTVLMKINDEFFHKAICLTPVPIGTPQVLLQDATRKRAKIMNNLIVAPQR